MKITGNVDLELFIKGHRPEDDGSYGIIFRFGYKYTIRKNNKEIETQEGEFDYYVISSTDTDFYEGVLKANDDTCNLYWLGDKNLVFSSIFGYDNTKFEYKIFKGLIMDYTKSNKIPPNYMSTDTYMYDMSEILKEMKSGVRLCGDELYSIKDCKYKYMCGEMTIENKMLMMSFHLSKLEDEDTIYENIIKFANKWNKIIDGNVDPSIYDSVEYTTINKFSQNFEINVTDYEYKYDERYEEYYPKGKLIFSKTSVNCNPNILNKECILTFISSEDFGDENGKGYETLYDDDLIGLFYKHDDEIIQEIIDHYKGEK